jgi:penicillin amidase
MQRIPLKYANRRFRASRDEAGVPHIEAESWSASIYGLGYMHAVDRATQMLFARSVARGKAAERIANQPELVETDKFFRKAALFRDLDHEVSLFDDASFDLLTSYCQGVNDGMKQVGRSLPMWAVGFKPKPWTQRAVLLIGRLLSFGGLVVDQQQAERLLIDLIQTGVDEQRLRELWDGGLDGADFELLRKVKISRQLSDQALELLTDLPRLAGSNAWAVSPQRSATGHALLASDPHLEVNRLPAIWYEAVLKWDDRYVMGATLPGCPLFAVARTERLAWGVTYLKGDACDFFVEDCRSGGANGWQYRRGKQWQDFGVREETIERRGDDPLKMRIYESDIGVLDGDPDSHENELHRNRDAKQGSTKQGGTKQGGPGHYLSFTWAGFAEGSGSAIKSWLDVVGCRDAKEAMDIVRDVPTPTLVWVFADDEGHIGRQACGWFPKRRRGVSGLVPVPAWDTRNHWQGFLPVDRLPREYDPTRGFVTSANEAVQLPSGLKLVTQTVPDYRKRRIDELLAANDQVTVEDMQAMQYDVTSIQARELLPVLLPHMPDGPIKDKLAAWDHRYNPESVEATIFVRLYRNVLLEIFGHERGIGWLRMLYLCTRVGYSNMMLTLIDRMLAKDHSGWWARHGKGKFIARAAEALEGETFEPWSETNSFHFTNRFFSPKRVGRVLGFHSSKIAMPGCASTLFQGHLLRAATRETTFAPSYHFVADLGSDEAHTNLPGGPSESRFSRYYRNDIPLWHTGQYKLLTLDGSAAE